VNYLFVIVGDPQEPVTVDGGYNGYSLHILGFPSDPDT
jgi:hypothetical protein